MFSCSSGSDNGSVRGSDNGSVRGSDNGSVRGSVRNVRGSIRLLMLGGLQL